MKLTWQRERETESKNSRKGKEVKFSNIGASAPALSVSGTGSRYLLDLGKNRGKNDGFFKKKSEGKVLSDCLFT